jgi:hypothetical protein
MNKDGAPQLTNEQFDKKWLSGTNVGRIDDYLGRNTSIGFYCKNEGCDKKWFTSPGNIIHMIGKYDNKMECCETCRKKNTIEYAKHKTHKVCSGPCGKNKSIEEFGNRASSIDGKQGVCRGCRYEKTKEWNKKNKKRRDKKSKLWRKKNLKKTNAQSVIRRQNNLENQRKKERAWEKKNRDRRRKQKRKRQKERIKTDINFRIKRNLRNGLLNALDGKVKNNSALTYLHKPIEDFKRLMESKFGIGWTWDMIELDHIVPVSHFDHTKEEEVEKCWHWSNFQPLLIADNRDKWNYLPQEYIDGKRIWKGKKVGWVVVK